MRWRRSGAARGLRWGEHAVSLSPGDAIVLYTDGVTEADRRRPLAAGELARELGAMLGGRPPGSATALAGALRTLAHARAGGPLRDDVVIVALHVEA
ncbi:MAG: SpoIIE family protein phosphatase [Solirubrobacterales bacterium]|nr:SpoIIE family protein phosphatase [Solirubrobacterales bacterium]